jgi:transposase
MDNRSTLEKILWATIGEPLYYCEECKRVVHVKDGVIKRNCEHTESRVMAPRKAIMSGKGFADLKTQNKIKVRYSQIMARLTGRNV